MNHKYFNGKKYYLNQNRWFRTKCPRIRLSHDIWNFYRPEDTIKKREIIHHKNGNPSDDRIENLEKMTHSEHLSLHNEGENNPMFGRDRSGKNNPMYDKHHTEESKKEISKANSGKKRTDDFKKKQSELVTGENNPNWKGGIKQRQIYLCSETVELEHSYEIYQHVNSLGEVLSSGFHIKKNYKMCTEEDINDK